MLCTASRSTRVSSRAVVAASAARAPRRAISTRSNIERARPVVPQLQASRSAPASREYSRNHQNNHNNDNLSLPSFSTRSMSTTSPVASPPTNELHLSSELGALAFVAIAALYILVDEAFAEEANSAVVAKASSMKDGEMREVKVGDTKILLVRLAGKFYATDLNCPHFGAPLNTGVLVGSSVSCPWHDARFDVKTGALECAPAIDGLRTHLVTVKGDDVIVTVSNASKTRPPIGGCDSCDKRTFVIVGAGAAGAVAAEALRQDGFKGRIVMLTEESQLPYDRTILSKGPGTPIEKIKLRDEAFWKANEIEVHRERKVRSVDAKTRTITFEDGSTMSYDSCLLATGAAPRTLNIPGADLENIKVLRNVGDSAAIADAAKPNTKVVVIGSSFIGMEIASALKKGKKVDNVVVVGMEKVPFERVLGSEVGQVMKEIGEENGVTFHMQRTAARFEGQNGKVTKVVLDDKTVLPADLVVMGAGVIPNTRIVKNVPLNRDGSISVDQHMKSVHVDNLYAAGDIARFPWGGEDIRVEHWAVAQNQGRVAAHNMAGKKVEFENVPFFWTRSFDMSLTYAGHATSFDEVLVKGDKKKRQFVAFYVKDNQVKAVASYGKGPQAIAATELFRINRMPSVADIRAATDFDLVEALRRTQNI